MPYIFFFYMQAMLSLLDVLVLQAAAHSKSCQGQQLGESVVLAISKECTTKMELAVDSVLVGV